jgi:hypothetical protein
VKHLQALAMSALLAWSGPAIAALSISGTVVVEPHPSALKRGQQASVTYTITNTGDEPLDYAGAGFTYRTFGPLSTLFPFPTEGTPPCGFRLLDLSTPPGLPGFVANTVDFSPVPIQPGETRQCTTGLRISAETAGPFVQRFAFSGLRDGRSVSSQLHVVFTLGEPPLAIPALTIWAFAFASLAVLLAGLYRFPRR